MTDPPVAPEFDAPTQTVPCETLQGFLFDGGDGYMPAWFSLVAYGTNHKYL